METAKFFAKPITQLTMSDKSKVSEMNFDVNRVMESTFYTHITPENNVKKYLFPVEMSGYIRPQSEIKNKLFLGAKDPLKDPDNLYRCNIGLNPFDKVNEYPNQEVVSITTTNGNGLIISKDSELITVNKHGKLIKSKPFIGMTIPFNFNYGMDMKVGSFKYGNNGFFKDLGLLSILTGIIFTKGSYDNKKYIIDLKTKKRLDFFLLACKFNHLKYENHIDIDGNRLIVKSKELKYFLKDVKPIDYVKAWIYNSPFISMSFLMGWGIYTDNFEPILDGRYYANLKWKDEIEYFSRDIGFLQSLSYMFMLEDMFTNITMSSDGYVLHVYTNVGYKNTTCPRIYIDRFEEMIQGLKFTITDKAYKTYMNVIEEARINNSNFVSIPIKELDNLLSKAPIDEKYNPCENRMKSFWPRWLFLSQYTYWTTIEKIEELPYRVTCYSLSSKEGHNVITHNGFIV